MHTILNINYKSYIYIKKISSNADIYNEFYNTI